MSTQTCRASDGKLGNFLELSDRAKSRARTGMAKRQSHVPDERKCRKSSILNSLDKFLDDDDATETTSYQSSFSSGLSAESNGSFPRSLPPRVEPTLEEDEHAERAPPRRRVQRRGSVTKYSLDDQGHSEHASESHHDDPSQSSLGDNVVDSLQAVSADKKKKKSLSSSSHHGSRHHHHKSKNHLDSAHSAHGEGSRRPGLALDRNSSRSMSVRSLHTDDEGSVATIDQRPLPMRMGDSTTSFDNSFAEDLPDVRSSRPQNKKTNSFDSCASTATMSSLDDDDTSFLPPKPRRPKNSLAGLASLPGSKPSHADDHLQDDRSIASQSANGEGGRQRYRRRGSVTKFSLEEAGESFEGEATLKDDHDHHRPPRPVRQSSGRKSLGNMLGTLPGSGAPSNGNHLQDDRSIGSTKSEGRQRYRRRGSVTKFSLDGSNHQPNDHQEQLPPRPDASQKPPKPQRKSLGGMLAALPSDSSGSGKVDYGYGFDDRSVNSDGILAGNRQRYHRRGSVTKFSIEGGEGGTVPPQQEQPNQHRRFSRRGSVTKYSLDN